MDGTVHNECRPLCDCLFQRFPLLVIFFLIILPISPSLPLSSPSFTACSLLSCYPPASVASSSSSASSTSSSSITTSSYFFYYLSYALHSLVGLPHSEQPIPHGKPSLHPTPSFCLSPTTHLHPWFISYCSSILYCLIPFMFDFQFFYLYVSVSVSCCYPYSSPSQPLSVWVGTIVNSFKIDQFEFHGYTRVVISLFCAPIGHS